MQPFRYNILVGFYYKGRNTGGGIVANIGQTIIVVGEGNVFNMKDKTHNKCVGNTSA